MHKLDLCISVGELLGITRVTISGCMEYNHIFCVNEIITGIINKGVNNVVLDITSLCFLDKKQEEKFIDILKVCSNKIRIHILANRKIVKLLKKQDIKSTLNLYNSTDEISEYLISEINNLSINYYDSLNNNNYKIA